MARNPDRILTEWLVLQVQSGNGKARETLLRLWYPLLKRYALARLGHREDAQDAVQDALLKVGAGIGTLRDPAAFPKWTYRILHRRCADQLRRRQRRERRESPQQSQEWETGEALQQGRHPELANDMHQALRKLKPESYLVIHLYYLHDLGLTEIAEITGTPVGTIKSRLFTARHSLKRHLGGYENE
jgi:RNA polymerase sigma factor (sigma-70 family)